MSFFYDRAEERQVLPPLLHTFVVTETGIVFFQPSLFPGGNRGSPGLAKATGRCDFVFKGASPPVICY